MNELLTSYEGRAMCPCHIEKGVYHPSQSNLRFEVIEGFIGKPCISHGLPMFKPAYAAYRQRTPEQWVWGVPGELANV